MMQAEVTNLIEEKGRIAGVIVHTPDGETKILSDLVVGCDGRTSTVRAEAGLDVMNFGAPMDVLWFRMSRLPNDPEESMGSFGRGAILVMINRGDYWQCGFVIAKGSLGQARERGVEFFREEITTMAPFMRAAPRKSPASTSCVVDRQRRPRQAMASARVAVHRRRRPRHVADRRSRDQPGDPGCGGRGQSTGLAFASRPGD